VRWIAPDSDGGSPVTGYELDVLTGDTVTRTITGITGTATSTVVTGLANGTDYRFRVRAVTAAGTSPSSQPSTTVTPATVPGTPVIGTAQAGGPGGARTAMARWSPSASDGGSPITGWRVTALRMSPTGAVLSRIDAPLLGPSARSRSFTLPAGSYRFSVAAVNAAGTSHRSARSNKVIPR
jgi:Fibronectin type III domain